jgi:hypothetical protein
MDSPDFSPLAEFARQVQTLVDLGYPTLMGMTPAAFTALVAPLEQALAKPERMPSLTPTERVPFVLVIKQEALPVEVTMPLTQLNRKAGFVDFQPEGPAGLKAFLPLPELKVPSDVAYLIFDVDTGSEFRNVTPEDALVAIREQGRSPLTVDEGIALLTQFPERLRKNHCFSLVGSRSGDRRVPALWISQGRPKLGWCWARNPHTWLGSASCAGRGGTTGAPSDVERLPQELQQTV